MVEKVAHVVRGNGLFVLPTGYPPNDPLMVNVFGHGIVAEIQPSLATPTSLIIDSPYAFYGGAFYARDSRIFGNRETVVVGFTLSDMWQHTAIMNAPIEVSVDGHYSTTIPSGSMWRTVGLPIGVHEVTFTYKGSEVYSPSSETTGLTIVDMEQATFTYLVDSTTANVGLLQDQVTQNLLRTQVGVVVTKVTVDSTLGMYTFTMWVTSEPTVGLGQQKAFPPVIWAVTIILAVIATLFFTALIAYQWWWVNVHGSIYDPISQQYFRTCTEYQTYLMTQQPDVWATTFQNGARFVCTMPIQPPDIMTLAYIGGGVALAVGGIYLVGKLVERKRG